MKTMLYSWIVLTVAVASASCDNLQDYQKSPNRRYGEPGNSGYDYNNYNNNNRRNEYGSEYDNTNAYSPYDTQSTYAQNTYNDPYDGYGGYQGMTYCKNRTAQMDIEMQQLMGMWYGVEFIPHLVGSPGTYRGDTCIVLHIAEIMDEPSTESGLYHRAVLQTNWWREYRHLQLLWDEDGRDVEYSLFFKNDSVGFWQSHGDQIGRLPVNRNYNQFTGTVQVLKAVGDHLLLHFCQPPTDGKQAQLFSVLLSREPRRLVKWEIDSTHDLLRRKNLSVTTRRLVCGNSASAHSLSAAAGLLAAVAAALLRLRSQLV